MKLALGVMDLTRWSLCAGLCLAAMACGRSDGGRLPVFGSVIGPGAEKLTGTISFIPDMDRASPGSVVPLVERLLSLRHNQRSLAGTLSNSHPAHVMRTRASQTSKLGLASTTGESIGRGATVEWKLQRTQDIVAQGPYQIDFKLD